MKTINKKIGVLLLCMVTACNLDGDLQNPNEIPVSGADVDLVMNSVQLDLADFFSVASGTVAPLVRQTAMSGGFRYQTAYLPQFQDNLWTFGYTTLVNAATVIKTAEPKKLTTHVAAAKIMSAYVYMTLVDIFGDVPQSSALKGASGSANFNPKQDLGSDVYAYALTLLSEARTELAKTGADAGNPLNRDIYFGGDRTLWNALANTLELKAWVNISTLPARAAEANAKIATFINATTGANQAGVELIDALGEDFTYKYSATTNPDSRHPSYSQYYGPVAGTAAGYISNSFLYELYRGKPDANPIGDATDPLKFSQDPRWRYYFYRQVGSIQAIFAVDPKSLGCTQGSNPPHYIAGNYPFCVMDPGFYGRDHGDGSGTPPDGPTITAPGAYPAGGRIDNNGADSNIPATDPYSVPSARGMGADGAGIQPIWMSFYTDFLRAEVVARAGNYATAQTLLQTAVQNSIDGVRDVATNTMGLTLLLPEPSTAEYMTGLDYIYALAPGVTNTTKMHTIGREWWVATWGNGVEGYNAYRRTGGYDHQQPTLQNNAGPWLRSMIYSANYVNLNENAAQKDSQKENRVFWDGNAETLN